MKLVRRVRDGARSQRRGQVRLQMIRSELSQRWTRRLRGFEKRPDARVDQSYRSYRAPAVARGFQASDVAQVLSVLRNSSQSRTP